jgi:hypothetical protein
MNEGKKDRRDPIRTIKTKNPVAKAHQTVGTGSGAHKDKKRAMKQGEVKHKNQEYAESLQDRLNAVLAESAVKDLRTELADKYRELAPGIEKYKDSFKAGQLYDALEAIADQHGAHRQFTSMMAGARNRAHMEYDTNPGGFQNWFWFLPFADDQNEGVAEEFNAEYDDEAGMADNNLETLKRAVDGIDDVINTGDNLPEWCQEKIAVAKSMLVTVWDYMLSEKDSEQGVAEAANVDPQFIDTQVTKILAGEARRMTNAPMAQLLAPVMKQYGLTLQQIDSMVPGGLKKAAAGYGIMMKEGWSDAMVARRTGGPRTPYSVYIKGKKWKDFENDDHARAVMDKLKAKFKADGRDPETITIAPTDISEGQTALEKFRKASAEREKKHTDAEKEMNARHARGEEDMKGSIDRLEKHVNTKEGLRDPKDNPCWKGYKPVGTKKKGSKTVPNCVPKEGWTHDSLAAELFETENTYEDRLTNLLNKRLGQ